MVESFLSRWPVATPDGIDGALSAVSDLLTPFTVRAVSHGSARQGRFRLNGLRGPGFSVGYVVSDIGFDLDVSSDDEPTYLLSTTEAGEVPVATGESRLTTTPAVAALIHPGDRLRLRPPARLTADLAIGLTRNVVQGELRNLLGTEPRADVRFAVALPFTSGRSRAVRPVLRQVLHDLDTTDDVLAHPAMKAARIRMLITCLLLSQPNSYTDALLSTRPVSHPRHVARVLEYIDAHHAEPLTLSEIAAASGRSVRSVHDDVIGATGVSPMVYLRQRRLDAARRELQSTEDSIAAVAYRTGFTHPGRFASLYRERFGELPTRTRLRG